MSEVVRESLSLGRFSDFVQRSFVASDVVAVDRWIRGHFRYRPDGQNEIVRTPDFMLNELQTTGYFQGDCDCVSVFYAAVLKSLGFRCRFAAIRFSDPSEMEHVFVEFFSGSDWVRVDPTVPVGTVHTELERMTQNI